MTILAQFKMSAQADWNHLVVDLRNNIFKLKDRFESNFEISIVLNGMLFSVFSQELLWCN